MLEVTGLSLFFLSHGILNYMHFYCNQIISTLQISAKNVLIHKMALQKPASFKILGINSKLLRVWSYWCISKTEVLCLQNLKGKSLRNITRSF